MTDTTSLFGLNEAAVAYAISAERILGEGVSFLEDNPSVIPIFVSNIFQSLEISIKYAGIESGLFTMKEARRLRSGHGIREIADLAVERLGGARREDIVLAMTCANSNERSATFVRKMLFGSQIENSRSAYASRYLGYGEVHDGGFAIIYPVEEWVLAIKQTARNLKKTVEILTQWRNSGPQPKPFIVWFEHSANSCH